MEDANGNLVQELPGHGLTGVPASSATPTFRDITALEEMVNNTLKVNADDPLKLSFSNNIGFYGSAFDILPETQLQLQLQLQLQPQLHCAQETSRRETSR